MLRLATYEAVFDCNTHVTLPNPPGVLWHSVVGKALHDIACVQPGKKCSDCKLLHSCDYPALFNTPKPPGYANMPANAHVPSPHVFQQITDSNSYTPVSGQSSKRLRMRFSLIDQANSRMHTVLACLARVAVNGFGKQRTRGELSNLLRIKPNGQHSVYSITGNRDQPGEIKIPTLANHEAIRVEFITPYRQPGKRGNSPAEFDLSAFLIAVIRRIDSLREFHSDGKLPLDFKALKAMSLREDLASARLRRSNAIRYSASHGKTIDISGMLGTVDLYGPLATTMWPFLYTGQHLNAGKNSSMGLGQYRLLVAE